MATNPVRALKKVRRQFLHKTPEEEQPNDIPSTFQSSPDDDFSIDPEPVTHFDPNKKLCFGLEHLNLYYDVTSAVVENRPRSKVVTLSLSRKEHTSESYWEHTAKKLESQGDLEAAMWAQRMRNRFVVYRKTMSEFYDQVNSEDPLIQVSISKAQRKAMLACKEMESKYAFQKYVQYLKKDTHVLLSTSYSEDFLKEINHTPEEFAVWAKENGMPKIFDINSQVFQMTMKAIMTFIPTIAQPINELEELENTIYDRDGKQVKVKVKFISFFEPSPGMPLNHCYFLVQRVDEQQETELQGKGDITETQLKKRVENSDEVADRTEN